MKKRFLLMICLLLMMYLYFIGYRLTPKQAADSHAFLEEGAQVVSEVDIGWGYAYIYKASDYHLTVLAIKKGFLWRAPASTRIKDVDDKNNNIRTIGWMSFTNNEKERATILVIENKDENVAFIETGKESERKMKSVAKGEIVRFVWDEALFIHNIKPVALSNDNSKLYRYGYPLRTTHFKVQDLKWNSIK